MSPGDWERYFTSLAAPPSQTEQDKCDNAERVMRRAVAADQRLSGITTTVLLQGSYKNNTNVSQESDVDLALICEDLFYYDLPGGYAPANFDIAPSEYTYSQYKDDVGRALRSYLKSGVLRGNKAYDVAANTYRVEADVAPFCRHRSYLPTGRWAEGVCLFPDDQPNTKVINYPEQHHRNGVDKNVRTGRRYKGVVRIVKSLRYDMAEDGITSARMMTGFGIECALYNVPDQLFQGASLFVSVRDALDHLLLVIPWYAASMTEVNGIKPLFHPTQKWSQSTLTSFLADVRSYVGYV